MCVAALSYWETFSSSEKPKRPGELQKAPVVTSWHLKGTEAIYLPQNEMGKGRQQGVSCTGYFLFLLFLSFKKVHVIDTSSSIILITVTQVGSVPQCLHRHSHMGSRSQSLPPYTVNANFLNFPLFQQLLKATATHKCRRSLVVRCHRHPVRQVKTRATQKQTSCLCWCHLSWKIFPEEIASLILVLLMITLLATD